MSVPQKINRPDSDEEKEFAETVGKFIMSEISAKVNKLDKRVGLRRYVLGWNFIKKVNKHLTEYDDDLLKNGITPTTEKEVEELGRVLIEEMMKKPPEN